MVIASSYGPYWSPVFFHRRVYNGLSTIFYLLVTEIAVHNRSFEPWLSQQCLLPAMHISPSSRRALTVTLLFLSSVTIFLTFVYSPSFRRYVKYPDVPLQLQSCPPDAYAAGQWIRKPNSSVLSSKDDVLALSAFEGCASSREVSWHLGTSWSEEQEAQKLQWRGNASSYNWIPGDGCEGYTEVQRESLLRQLVEDGGWLVLGGQLCD